MLSRINMPARISILACFTLCYLVILPGCAPVISKGLMNEAQKMGFDEILRDPDAQKGKIVILSGIILDSKNTKEGTMLEILQTPAEPSGRPRDIDESKGRFMALYKGFLDVAVYRRGREVTVGGEVIGKKKLPLGEISYIYPLIQAKELHLWPVEKEERIYCYPPPYWWHPWWYYPGPWPGW